MDLKLFDYTIDEIEEKLFEAEHIKRDLLSDLNYIEQSLEVIRNSFSNTDEFTLHSLTKKFEERKNVIIDAIKYYDSLIQNYNEYIKSIESRFIQNKPHEIHKEDAKILSIIKDNKGK